MKGNLWRRKRLPEEVYQNVCISVSVVSLLLLVFLVVFSSRQPNLVVVAALVVITTIAAVAPVLGHAWNVRRAGRETCPDGWVPFGSHIGCCHNPLQFSEAVAEDGYPLMEKKL